MRCLRSVEDPPGGGLEFRKFFPLRSQFLAGRVLVPVDSWAAGLSLSDSGVAFEFADHAIYTPVITLGTMVSQAFFKGEQRSCKAAVFRIAAFWNSKDRTIDDTNSGDYRKARCQVPFEAVRTSIPVDRQQCRGGRAEPPPTSLRSRRPRRPATTGRSTDAEGHSNRQKSPGDRPRPDAGRLHGHSRGHAGKSK